MDKQKMVDAMINEICMKFFTESNYKDTKKLKEANSKAYDLYWDDPKFADIRGDLEIAIATVCTAYEEQGFVLGFKKAMEIMGGGFSYLMLVLIFIIRRSECYV